LRLAGLPYLERRRFGFGFGFVVVVVGVVVGGVVVVVVVAHVVGVVVVVVCLCTVMPDLPGIVAKQTTGHAMLLCLYVTTKIHHMMHMVHWCSLASPFCITNHPITQLPNYPITQLPNHLTT
jgi:hypothetical protein